MTTDIKVPTVGFVSLGCPNAYSDAERILTKLRAEGYEISPSYENSDLVIVNTCGFIDAAVEEQVHFPDILDQFLSGAVVYEVDGHALVLVFLEDR